jgi:hypothetical protein
MMISLDEEGDFMKYVKGFWLAIASPQAAQTNS